MSICWQGTLTILLVDNHLSVIEFLPWILASSAVLISSSNPGGSSTLPAWLQCFTQKTNAWMEWRHLACQEYEQRDISPHYLAADVRCIFCLTICSAKAHTTDENWLPSFSWQGEDCKSTGSLECAPIVEGWLPDRHTFVASRRWSTFHVPFEHSEISSQKAHPRAPRLEEHWPLAAIDVPVKPDSIVSVQAKRREY